MTIYEKELVSKFRQQYGEMPVERFFERMFDIGVLDPTLCKVLAIREAVADYMEQGMKKIDAMWTASEKFCCTYEYVRKCIYYYTDIGFR